MARVLDRDLYFKNVERRDRERALRTQYNPGNVFLRSLAQSGAQAGANLVGGLAQGAANYYLLGGKRAQDQADAVTFPGLRPGYFEDYYGIEPQQQAGVMPQQPMQRPGQMPASQPAKKTAKPKKAIKSEIPDLMNRDVITLPDGRNVVEAKEGEQAPIFYNFKRYIPVPAKDAVAKLKAGQPEQKSIVDLRREEQQKMISDAPSELALGDGRIAVKIQGMTIPPGQTDEQLNAFMQKNGITLVNGVPYRPLNRDQTARYVAEQKNRQLEAQRSAMPTLDQQLRERLPPPNMVVPGMYSTADEVKAYQEQQQLNFRNRVTAIKDLIKTEATERGKDVRKRIDKVAKQLDNDIKNAHEFIVLNDVESIDKTRDRMFDGLLNAKDPTEVDLYLNAMQSLPSNEAIEKAAILSRQYGRRVAKVGGKPSSFTIKMPSRKDYQSAAYDAQIAVNDLRTKIAGATDAKEIASLERQLQTALAKRDGIVFQSQGDNSLKEVFTDSNGDVYVPQDYSKSRIGDKGIAGEGTEKALKSRSGTLYNSMETQLISNVGNLKPKVRTLVGKYKADPSKHAGELASYFDSNGNLKDIAFVNKKDFTKNYPNLAPYQDSIEPMGYEAALLSAVNKKITGKNLRGDKVTNLLTEANTNYARGQKPDDAVADAMTLLGLN